MRTCLSWSGLEIHLPLLPLVIRTPPWCREPFRSLPHHLTRGNPSSPQSMNGTCPGRRWGSQGSVAACCAQEYVCFCIFFACGNWNDLLAPHATNILVATIFYFLPCVLPGPIQGFLRTRRKVRPSELPTQFNGCVVVYHVYGSIIPLTGCNGPPDWTTMWHSSSSTLPGFYFNGHASSLWQHLDFWVSSVSFPAYDWMCWH